MRYQRYLVLLSDLLAIAAAFLAAGWLRFRDMHSILKDESHVLVLGSILLCYLLCYIFYIEETPVYRRSGWRNLKIVLIFNMVIAVGISLFLYLSKTGGQFSRLFYLYFFALNFVLMFLGRQLDQQLSLRYLMGRKKQLVVFANDRNVLKVLYKLMNSRLFRYEITGIVVMHQDGSNAFYKVQRNTLGKSYLNDRDMKTMEFLKKSVVDEALISLPDSSHTEIQRLIELLESMGIDSHLTMNTFSLGAREAAVEEFGMYHVLTFSPRVFTDQELVLKRFLDILGGLAGSLLCIVVGIFVAPAIWIEDPGPVIFKQKRVGQNGRQFYIYKFRSMYQDAEERKKELMQQNEMNGLMFKIKDDPRITKVGKFIRKTSLDEFPQFFNVLAGDMSLVGTRPPTVDEFNQYSAHHKRRLRLKPGITGLWQISGRSDIKDFEDVVKLDVEYIDHWTIFSDLRILLMTVWVVIARRGSE